MSKKSFTSVFVQKVAPKFHKIMGYTINRVRDDSFNALLREMKIEPVELNNLSANQPIKLHGKYDWKHCSLLDKYPHMIVYHQISLYLQRIKFMKNLNMPQENKIKSIMENPPALIFSVSYPITEYSLNYNGCYLRGILSPECEDKYFVFSTCYPYVHGGKNAVINNLKELSSKLKIDLYQALSLVLNMPKYLVALPQSPHILTADLMTMPSSYDALRHTVLLHPPMLKSSYASNFNPHNRPLYTKNILHDFDGLEKYNLTSLPQNDDVHANSFESLLEYQYPGTKSEHNPESLSDYLLETFKIRNQCHIYGKYDSHRHRRVVDLSEEIREHHRLTRLHYISDQKFLLKSKYSKSNLLPPKKVAKKIFLPT